MRNTFNQGCPNFWLVLCIFKGIIFEIIHAVTSCTHSIYLLRYLWHKTVIICALWCIRGIKKTNDGIKIFRAVFRETKQHNHCWQGIMCQYTSYLKTPHTSRARVSECLMDSGISFLVCSQILLNCVYYHKNLWTKEAKQTCNTFLVLNDLLQEVFNTYEILRNDCKFYCSDFWLVVYYHELPTEWQL